MKPLQFFTTAYRFVLRGLFSTMLLFWTAVGVYIASSYISKGPEGVRTWILHVAYRPKPIGAIPSMVDWMMIALGFIIIAIITMILWLANRRFKTGDIHDK